MVDRLISGAGAWADLADRAVRAAVPRWAATRVDRSFAGPVGVGLLLAALLLAAAGSEAVDDPLLRTVAPGAAAGSTDLGRRAYVEMTGELADDYVEWFDDLDGDGVMGEGETAYEWIYFLVDPGTRTAVAVRSGSPPDEMFRTSIRGTIQSDPAFVAERVDALLAEDPGLRLDRRRLVDATMPGTSSPAPLVPGGPVPPDGTLVELAGVPTVVHDACTRGSDRDGDAECDPEEYDAVTYAIVDPETREGFVVFARPEALGHERTVRGMLRTDRGAVADAVAASCAGLAAFGIEVGTRYVLDDGAAPGSAPAAFALALVLGYLGVGVLVGAAGGPLVYRRSTLSVPGPTASLPPGGWLATRATGVLHSPDGAVRVREASARLVLFEPGSPSHPGPGPDGDPPVHGPPAPPAPRLIVERTGRPHGIGLATGGVRLVDLGRAVALGGPRPALRVVTPLGPLLLAFDTADARDRAAAEIAAATSAAVDPPILPRRTMDAFEIATLEQERAASGRLYHEFLRVPDLSAGLYVLEVGAVDPQQPHTEDEVYYVVEGRARITVGEEVRAVQPGSIVFVGTGVPHRFHDITERLVLFVAFGPAEGSRATGAGLPS